MRLQQVLVFSRAHHPPPRAAPSLDHDNPFEYLNGEGDDVWGDVNDTEISGVEMARVRERSTEP